MKSFGNEKRVQQGEDWNLDLLVSARSDEYIPYLISSELANPFFVVTVGSTKYDKNERYVKSWWNSIKNSKIPTFYDTNPIYCGELPETSDTYRANTDMDEHQIVANQLDNKDDNNVLFTCIDDNGEEHDYYGIKVVRDEQSFTPTAIYYYRKEIVDGVTVVNPFEVASLVSASGFPGGFMHWDEDWCTNITVTNAGKNNNYLMSFIRVFYTRLDEIGKPGNGAFYEFTMYDSAAKRYLYQYTKSSDTELINGHKPYYYFYYDYSGPSVYRRNDYECRIKFNFLSKDTADWTGQNYIYQITLVSGQLMEDTIKEIYDYHEHIGDDLSDWPIKTEELTDLEYIELEYNYIKTRWPDSFQVDIDSDSPLGYIETPIPILLPTKLEVMNNLRRLI